MISFANPLWLAGGGLVIVLLIFLYKEMHRRRATELQRFAAPHLLGKLCVSVSSQRRLLKKSLLVAAVFCCFVALARPQYGFKWIDVKRKGIDILFAVDTSKSMLAEDVSPNRLKRAKYAILDFVGQLEGDRVGLMPFSGSAFLMCPMTIDYNAFESSLQVVDTKIIPRAGTNLAKAIEEAESILTNEANHKILVLITDGENSDPNGEALQAAKKAAGNGMAIFTVGVGTREGELIPFNHDGKAGFVKDESGNFVTSRLDESMLTKIAEATGGLYVPLGANGEGLQTIYQEKLSLIPKEELAEKRHKVALDRFVWPLGAAIVLLMLEFLVGGRKSTRSLRIPFIKTAGRRKKQKAAATLMLCTALSFAVSQAEASKGEEAYNEGDFLTAASFYDEQLQDNPVDARLHYNYGTAAYKNNMFEDAAKAFSEALKSDDLSLQEEAYYNRGNALFQRGNETLQTDSQHTVEMWEEAVASYDGSLQLNSLNDDARFNLDLVSEKLEELKKQQEQEQDQQEQDKKDKEDSEDQEQDKDKKDDQGEPKSQDQEQQDSSDEDDGGEPDDKQGEQDPPKDPDSETEGEQEDQGQDAKSAEDEKQQDDAESEAAKAAEEAEKKEQAAREQQRRAQGKMTSEEAMQLLNSLKDETGELNFVPSAASDGSQEQETARDW